MLRCDFSTDVNYLVKTVWFLSITLAAYRPLPEASPAITSQVVMEGEMGEIAKPFNFVILAYQKFNSSQAKSEREVKELQYSREK